MSIRSSIVSTCLEVLRVDGALLRGLSCAVLLLGGALVWAPGISAGADPQDIVRQASEHVLTELEREGVQLSGNPQRLYTLVDNVLLQHMDFMRMARWVLGKHWRTATPAQQARFVEEFRRLLVRTYATALAGYSGQHIEFLPQRDSARADEAVVRAEIRQAGGPSIPVQFSLYHNGTDWKAYDVTIDGISLVANYRATFGAEIRATGLERLINALAVRNQQALFAP